MTVLALDTTSESGSLALHSNGCTIHEQEMSAPGGYAQILFDALARFARETACDLSTVACFAAAAGPGSFTGVRVGLTAAMGLAEAFGKKACAVSNLRAAAACAQTNRLRAVVLDARRSEVYAAVYDRHLQPISPETVQPLEQWLATLDPAASYEFITALPISLENTPFTGMPVTRPPRSLARAVALCAAQDGEANLWSDPALLDANYVRRSDAELFWQDKAR